MNSPGVRFGLVAFANACAHCGGAAGQHAHGCWRGARDTRHDEGAKVL